MTSLRRGIRKLSLPCLAAGMACGSNKAADSAGTAPAPFTQVTLERKPCFGTCPVYALSISSDGVVVFDGRRNVLSVGRVTSHMEKDRIRALQALVVDHQFYGLDEKYGYGEPNCRSYAADAPTVIITVTTKDRVKRVEHDLGCSGVPPRLPDLQQKIDSLAGVWRFTTGQRPQ